MIKREAFVRLITLLNMWFNYCVQQNSYGISVRQEVLAFLVLSTELQLHEKKRNDKEIPPAQDHSSRQYLSKGIPVKQR